MNHPETIGTGPTDTSSRRDFLKQAGSLGIAAAAFPWLIPRWAAPATAAVEIPELISPPAATAPLPPSGSDASPDDNIFQSPQIYALSLAGPPVQVFGFHGGEPVAQYVTGAPAADGSIPQKLSGLQYQDIVFYYLPIKGAAINNWLIDSMLGKAPALNGSIEIQGSQSGESGNMVNISYSNRVSFGGALIKHITFPEAVRTNGDPAAMRITLAIQHAEWFPKTSSNIQVMSSSPPLGPLKGLFSVNIPGIAPNEVTRIEPVVYSTTLIQPTQGAGYQRAIPRELSTLRIQLPESKADSLYSWHQEFVMKGLNTDAYKRAGRIQWMSLQSPRQSILTLKLSGLGILSVVRLPSKPGYVQAEMYCQKLVPEFF
jgi:hypothetical protein